MEDKESPCTNCIYYDKCAKKKLACAEYYMYVTVEYKVTNLRLRLKQANYERTPTKFFFNLTDNNYHEIKNIDLLPYINSFIYNTPAELKALYGLTSEHIKMIKRLRKSYRQRRSKK
jgi:hypothetical protein